MENLTTTIGYNSSNQTPESTNSTALASEFCTNFTFVGQTIIIGTLCVIGLVGNIVAFIVFCKDHIKTSTSFLFQALSFVDSVLLVLVIPVYCLEPIPSDVLTEYKAKIHSYIVVYFFPFAMMAQTATIWTTVLVAINRFIAVCKPYQASRLCTVLQAKKQITVVILGAIVFWIPQFFEGRVVASGEANVPVYTKLGSSKIYNIAYRMVGYLLVMFVLPLSILTILNMLLIRALKEIRKRRAEMQSLRQQQDNNVTLVLIIVVLVFTICQVPAFVNQICWIFMEDSARLCGHFHYFLRIISNILVITNSAVNFLIYFIFNTRFRQVLFESVCKQEQKHGYHKQRNTTINHHPTTLDGTRDTLL